MYRVIFACLLVGSVYAAGTVGPTARLAWDYETPLPWYVDGFRLYCANEPVWTGTDLEVALGETEMQMGQQDCFVTAYGGDQESDPSNVLAVKYLIGKPVAPTNLRVPK